MASVSRPRHRGSVHLHLGVLKDLRNVANDILGCSMAKAHGGSRSWPRKVLGSARDTETLIMCPNFRPKWRIYRQVRRPWIDDLPLRYYLAINA